jgi:outer membrane cobalamin receptor
MNRKIFYLIIAACLAPVFLYSQEVKNPGISVKGQIVDSLTKETVPYATVAVAEASDPKNVIKRLASDENGAFEVAVHAPGNFIFTFQSVAKRTAIKKIELPANKKTMDLGIILMTDIDTLLAEITVTAQKPLVKMEIDKITYNLEDDPEAKTNTVLEMFRKVPMVTVDGEEKIQLKGSDNFKIYLNGKPTNMLSGNNASTVLKSMPASSVKNVEVITEPGAKYDAEGVGGIINIITIKNTPLQGYTATISGDITTLGGYRAGTYATTKVGAIGFTVNYNYNHSQRPWTTYKSIREQFPPFSNTLKQEGRNRNSGNNNFGMAELSYEIDTLNLFRIGVDFFTGNSTSRQEIFAEMIPNDDNGFPYSYDLISRAKNNYGASEIEADFQHATHKKDELLTFSYRFVNEPNGSEQETTLENVKNYYNNSMYPRRSINDAYTNEHTAQIDYTTPTLKNQSIEAGVKYIQRISKSDVDERIFDENSSEWKPYRRPTDKFDHTQYIYSSYLAYSIKYKKIGYKAGIRAEGTSLDAKYKEGEDMNFSTDYFNIVPVATVSYMLNMSSQFRAGYNMRISRPGIWYLNPYINNSDPQNISYGNPHLSSEKSHSFNLNYSMFTQKVNINASLNYRFINNSIESYTFVNPENGVNETTYENIGKNQDFSFFAYGRWSVSNKFNISLNFSMRYVNIENPVRSLSAKGFGELVYVNAQYNLPKEFTVSAAFQYFKQEAQLQTKTDAYTIHTIMLNKTLLKKKLTIGLIAQSPFAKYINFRSTVEDPFFRAETVNSNLVQDFRLRISYRFGTMKGNIKQISRGISNDDSKGGGNSGGGSNN